jgi:hypothetical protein
MPAPMVAPGRERVLRQIVRADGEEIDVPRDRWDRQRGGGRLDHRAECRTAFDSVAFRVGPGEVDANPPPFACDGEVADRPRSIEITRRFDGSGPF